MQEAWPWAERRATLLTHAPYTTGTVATTPGSTAVTGTGTAWNTANTYGQTNVRTTGVLVVSGSGDPYRISAVGGDTSLTLETRWIGAAALADATYTYLEAEYDLAADFGRLKHPRTFTAQIPIVPRDEFDRLWPRNTRQGTPTVCTIVDVGVAASTTRVQRVIFAPVPHATVPIPYWYLTRYLAVTSAGVAQESLSADTDEPIGPVVARMALVHYAAEHYYRDRKDDTRATEHAGKYVDLVNRLKQDKAPERDLPRLQVVARHDVNRLLTVRQGSGRFVTGASSDAWDQLRD